MSTIVYGISISVDERNSRLMEVAFKHKQDAEDVARAAGWYGCDGNLVPLVIYDSAAEYQNQVDADKLASAKNRLTPDELDLLRKHFNTTVK